MSVVSNRPSVAWRRLGAAQVNAGTTPWDFSSIDLSSAGSTAVRSTASPPGLIEGASFLTCSTSGIDAENGRARAMIEPPSYPPSWRYLRCAFWLYLPTGFRASVVAGGSMQTWKLDCFPTTNNQVLLLYYQTDDTHQLQLRENGVNTPITDTFTLSEGIWHRVEITLKLQVGPSGYARVRVDGTEVARGFGVRTIYAATNGSGHKLPYIRFGLTAMGLGQATPTTLHIDDCSVDVAS